MSLLILDGAAAGVAKRHGGNKEAMGHKQILSVAASMQLLLLLLLPTHRASINHDVMCCSLLCVNGEHEPL